MTGTKAEGWYIENAKKAVEDGRIVYVGKYDEPDYELIMTKNCELAVESAMISYAPEVKEKLEELGIPVLVNGKSAVLTAHCEKSGAGCTYQTCDEFVQKLDALMRDDAYRRDMGKNGKRYVDEYYSWQTILTQVCSLIDGRNELR